MYPPDKISSALSPADVSTLQELYLRGTPANTLRAYERDLTYLAEWKQASFGAVLAWPEDEAVALRFILDHARDLSETAADDPARATAETLIGMGLRRSLACPAPATLDRRIASWRAFHRMRNLISPFETPALRQARAKARRAAARRPAPKSAKPITRDVLEAMLATCGPGLAGLRDRALLLLAWASGGRRRAELSALRREDISLDDFAANGLLWIRLVETKTTGSDTTPVLVLKGRAARTVAAWIDAAGIEEGPLFRPMSKAGRPLPRPLSAAGIARIVKTRLTAAGFPEDFASAHGLRSGFLTQAALDGAPLQAAMRLSLHRSAVQAQRYYSDVDIAENPATDLLK